MSDETTARPWEAWKDHQGSWWIVDQEERRVAYVGHDSDARAEGDARLIVEAINAIPETAPVPTCSDCGAEVKETRFRDGTVWGPEQLAGYGRRKHNRVLCMQHFRLANEARRKDIHIWAEASPMPRPAEAP